MGRVAGSGGGQLMRIVQLANFHTPTSGGLRTVLDELGRRYVAMGHRVCRIVPGERDEVLDVHGVEEIRLRAPLLPGGSGYRMIVDVTRVDALLRHIRPEVVELSDKTTLVRSAARRRRVGATVVTISHERIDSILDGRAPSWMPLRRVADRRNAAVAAASDAVVCCSSFAAHEYHRINVRHVHRVPLGVDLQAFRPGVAGRRERGDRVELVVVGRLSPEKRPGHAVAVLCELVERGVDAHLSVAGDGAQRAELERGAAGLPVTFLGHVASRSTMAALIGAADVCLAPCPVETFGLAALEALACGTPIVVPDAGGLRELVAGQADAGRAVVDGDAASWSSRAADAVLELVGQGRDARVAARQHAERFSWDAVTLDMLSLMHRAGSRDGSLVEGSRAEETVRDGGVRLASVG